MYQTILFDLDGTLTNPALGITNSLAYALEKFNIEVTDKKELYRFIGPPLQDSVEKGFKHALPAIIDGNITTLLIAGVLFFLGTGPIKGFAVTLSLGVFVTIFTAVFVTKVILKFVLSTFKIEKEKLFWKGVKNAELENN